MGIKTSVTCPGAGCGRQVDLGKCPNCGHQNWRTYMDQNGSDVIKCESCDISLGSVKCPHCGCKIDAAKFGNWTGPCFIATELYGYNSPQVAILRSWRDRSLMPNYGGRLFIETYYRGAPTVVRAIQRFPILRDRIRALVEIVIRIVSPRNT